mmetsp:Transcript_34798/g.97756  ORF Transcript_34798/g.97756 Transcript_34798/m.97756 type:complete len:442 (+) Transcript_34798:459-1784(+)
MSSSTRCRFSLSISSCRLCRSSCHARRPLSSWVASRPRRLSTSDSSRPFSLWSRCTWPSSTSTACCRTSSACSAAPLEACSASTCARKRSDASWLCCPASVSTRSCLWLSSRSRRCVAHASSALLAASPLSAMARSASPSFCSSCALRSRSRSSSIRPLSTASSRRRTSSRSAAKEPSSSDRAPFTCSSSFASRAASSATSRCSLAFSSISRLSNACACKPKRCSSTPSCRDRTLWRCAPSSIARCAAARHSTACRSSSSSFERSRSSAAASFSRSRFSRSRASLSSLTAASWNSARHLAASSSATRSRSRVRTRAISASASFRQRASHCASNCRSRSSTLLRPLATTSAETAHACSLESRLCPRGPPSVWDPWLQHSGFSRDPRADSSLSKNAGSPSEVWRAAHSAIKGTRCRERACTASSGVSTSVAAIPLSGSRTDNE